MKKLLQTLTETFGPSGYEDEVRKIVRREVEPLADEVRVDSLGNLIVRKRFDFAAHDLTNFIFITGGSECFREYLEELFHKGSF